VFYAESVAKLDLSGIIFGNEMIKTDGRLTHKAFSIEQYNSTQFQRPY